MKNRIGMSTASLASIVIALLACENANESAGQIRVLSDGLARESGVQNELAATPQSAAGNSKANCGGGAALHRSAFTDSVKDGTPRNMFAALDADDHDVAFFTEVIGAGKKRIRHRWFHDDSEITDISFEIAGDRSRSWSSKTTGGLEPGVLRVEVLVGGCSIGQQSIEIAAGPGLDPGARTGWMRPDQALETALARQSEQSNDDSDKPRPINRRDASGDTRLTAAIRRGDEPEARKLILDHDMKEVPDAIRLTSAEYEDYRQMADPFLRDRDGVSPIELARRTGQQDIAELLIESATRPAKPHRRSRRGPSRPSNVGMWSDSVIRSLTVGKGAEQRFANGDTALIRAVRQGNERAVVTLLQLGTKEKNQPLAIAEQLYSFDAGGRQPLDIARSEGFYGVERFLEMALAEHRPGWALSRATFAASMDGAEPGECRKVGFADEPELYFFAELTDMQGEEVRHEWRFQGETVHTANFDVQSRRGKTQSKRRFSPSDVGQWDVDVVGARGQVLGTRRLRYLELTPRIKKNREGYIGIEGCNLGAHAMYALVDAHAPISEIQYLLDQGATLKRRSKRYEDLFFKSIESGNISLTRWFLDRGAKIDATVRDGRMPLAIAAEAGDVPMVLFLITEGADIDKQRYRGKLTALQVASVELNVDLVRVLLENGADPNVPSDGGYTALHGATRRCSADLSALLLEHGADPGVTGRKGETPRDYAAKCRDNETWQSGMPGLAPLTAQAVPAQDVEAEALAQEVSARGHSRSGL